MAKKDEVAVETQVVFAIAGTLSDVFREELEIAIQKCVWDNLKRETSDFEYTVLVDGDALDQKYGIRRERP